MDQTVIAQLNIKNNKWKPHMWHHSSLCRGFSSQLNERGFVGIAPNPSIPPFTAHCQGFVMLRDGKIAMRCPTPSFCFQN